MTAIVLPVIDRSGGRRLTTLPHRYALSPQGEYAHLPRSAAMFPSWKRGGVPDPTRERLVVHSLCGQVLHRPTLTDDPAGPICGTCTGRAEGVDPTHPGVAYRPRGIYWLPKKLCPGPRLGLILEAADGQTAICLFCGITERMRYSGGPYNGSMKLTAHPHDGRGVACPDHGWRDLMFHSPDLHPRPWCTVGRSSRHACNRWAMPFWVLTDHHQCPPAEPQIEYAVSPWVQVLRRGRPDEPA